MPKIYGVSEGAGIPPAGHDLADLRTPPAGAKYERFYRPSISLTRVPEKT